jgi:hypothetical protein
MGTFKLRPIGLIRGRKAHLLKFRFRSRSGFGHSLLKSLPTTLLRKGLIENPENAWIFENFVPRPYRRDHKPFQKRLERKPPNSGVINWRNGCNSAIWVKRSNA